MAYDIAEVPVKLFLDTKICSEQYRIGTLVYLELCIGLMA